MKSAQTPIVFTRLEAMGLLTVVESTIEISLEQDSVLDLAIRQTFTDIKKKLQDSLNIGDACRHSAHIPEAPGQGGNYSHLPDFKLCLDSFTVRTSNCLRAEGIFTYEKLLSLSLKDLKKIPNFGKRSQSEVIDWLSSLGLSLSVGQGGNQ